MHAYIHAWAGKWKLYLLCHLSIYHSDPTKGFLPTVAVHVFPGQMLKCELQLIVLNASIITIHTSKEKEYLLLNKNTYTRGKGCVLGKDNTL
jgi:hypothetical protein